MPNCINAFIIKKIIKIRLYELPCRQLVLQRTLLYLLSDGSGRTGCGCSRYFLLISCESAHAPHLTDPINGHQLCCVQINPPLQPSSVITVITIHGVKQGFRIFNSAYKLSRKIIFLIFSYKNIIQSQNAFIGLKDHPSLFFDFTPWAEIASIFYKCW